MKKIYLFYSLTIIFVVCVFVKYIDEKYINKIPPNYGDLPIVRIHTQEGISLVNKTDYVNCSFEISNCDINSHNFKVSMKDTYDSEDGGVGIRLRGNSTSTFPKKPYRIKFSKNQSLFGLRASNDWVLLADYLDPSKMRNYAAYMLGNRAFDNLDFTPTPTHVVLEINGNYKGVYLLCEQIDEENGRTGIEIDSDKLYANYQTKEFPFLVEMSRGVRNDNTVNEADLLELDGYFTTEIKYPEVSKRQIVSGEDVIYNYIGEYLSAVRTTLKTKNKIKVSFRDEFVGFEDLVDIDSLIDFNLLNEFMCNPDAATKSSYMYKADNIINNQTGEVKKYSKMEFGPVWDFDIALSNVYTAAPCDTTYYDCVKGFVIFNNSVLFRTFLEDEQYFALVKERWHEVREEVLNTLNYIKEYRKYLEGAAIYDCQKIYGAEKANLFVMQYDYLENFLAMRVEFFDEIFSLKHDIFIEKYFS